MFASPSRSIARLFPRLALVLVALAFLAPARPADAFVSQMVLDALDRIGNGTASHADEALAFVHNDDINRMRLSGYLDDTRYQAAQRSYAQLNQEFAAAAAADARAGFTVQTSKSTRFSPGTDSDYIVTVKSKDPVGQIRRMQQRYNDIVNNYMEQTLGRRGLKLAPRTDWHNKLDVDFMADPEFVTDEQFRQVARLNNDAYTRRNAAEYERISRMKDGRAVRPEEFRDYAEEMKDFIRRKQQKLAKWRRNPALLKDPRVAADFHRIMAQEQKYIERIESANKTLRKQAGLKPQIRPAKHPFYETRIDRNGKLVIQKHRPSIALLGSKRSPTNFGTTAAASAVAENSLNRAIRELGESMAQAHALNPRRWANVADDIAVLADQLGPAEKGRLIEKIRQARGREFAGKVAEKMRARARAAKGNILQRTDRALQNALGLSNDLKGLRGLRGRFNRAAAKALGKLGHLGRLGTAAELLQVKRQFSSYYKNMQKALDPNITDAEADAYFKQAQDAALGVARSGMMGALFEAVPTLGAIYGGWTLGYDGSRWFLTETATGRWINRGIEGYARAFDDMRVQAAEDLTEYLGGESSRMRSERELRALEESYWRAIREGRVRLKRGATTQDVAALLRAGRLLDARDLLEPVKRPTAGPSEAGAEVWRLQGAPKVEVAEGGSKWKKGMDYHFESEYTGSAGSVTVRESSWNVHRHTGRRLESSKNHRDFLGTVSIGAAPRFLIADHPATLSVSATAKLLRGTGWVFVEGWLEGKGVAIESSIESRKYFHARAGKRPTDNITYTISVRRSSSNVKTLTLKVRRAATITWTYVAAIGVGADDALEQLRREKKARPSKPFHPGATLPSGKQPKTSSPKTQPSKREAYKPKQRWTARRDLYDFLDESEALADSGLDVDIVAGGHGRWFSAGTGRGRADYQEMHSGSTWNELFDDVVEARGEGLAVMDMAFDGKRWTASLGDLGPKVKQSIRAAKTTEEAADLITSMWKKKYRVTSALRDARSWKLVFTKGGDLYGQSFKFAREWDTVTAWMREKAGDGKSVTTLVRGKGMWLAVASKGTGYDGQRWSRRKSFDDMKTAIRKAWDDGFRLTEMTTTSSGWLALFSKLTRKAKK